MNNKNNIHQRYVWQDHCKGLAILVVVLGHMLDHENIYHGETFVSYLIYGFHMPLFFLMSGYTLQINIEEGILGFKQYALKHLKRVLFPGILFSGFKFIFDSIHALLNGKKYLFQYLYYYANKDLLYHTFAMDSRSLISQYWFFPALFSALLLIWWVLYIANMLSQSLSIRNEHKRYFRSVGQLALLISLIVLNIFLKDHHIVLPLCMREAMLGVFYVWLGHLLHRTNFERLSNKSKIFLTTCFAILYVTTTSIWLGRGYELLDFYNSGVDNMPMSFVLGISGSLVIILLYMILDGTRKEDCHISALVYAGQHSMWVYGFHFFFLELWFWINNSFPCFRSMISVIIKLLVTVIIMSLSLGTAYLLNNIVDVISNHVNRHQNDI